MTEKKTPGDQQESFSTILSSEVNYILGMLQKRARDHEDNLLDKGEVYTVLRERSLLMTSTRVNLADIFISGLMGFLEDAVRFKFVGKETVHVIAVEEAIRAAEQIIERSIFYGGERLLQASCGEGQQGQEGNRE